MASQISPTRMVASDRFPMVSFNIRTDEPNKRYEVAVASDPMLFQPEFREKRTKGTFFSSRGAGFQPIEQGAAVYVLPPEILARFAGQEKLYFALATFSNGKGSAEIVKVPTPGSPYINLQGLSGRSLRRVRMVPSRQRMMSSYQTSGGSEMEWAGDAAAPGSQPIGSRAGSRSPSPPIAPRLTRPHLITTTVSVQYQNSRNPGRRTSGQWLRRRSRNRTVVSHQILTTLLHSSALRCKRPQARLFSMPTTLRRPKNMLRNGRTWSTIRHRSRLNQALPPAA